MDEETGIYIGLPWHCSVLQDVVTIDSPEHDPPNFSSTILDRNRVWFPPPQDLEQSPDIHWLHSQSTKIRNIMNFYHENYDDNEI